MIVGRCPAAGWAPVSLETGPAVGRHRRRFTWNILGLRVHVGGYPGPLEMVRVLVSGRLFEDQKIGRLAGIPIRLGYRSGVAASFTSSR